jgi:50S ribosomal protein L16 3-hydroxylase
MLNVQAIFGEFPLSRFIEEYLHRLPLAMPCSAACVQSLASWQTLDAMLQNPDLASIDLIVARDGQRYPGDAPQDPTALRRLEREGWTLLVRHAEKHDAAIAQLAAAFAETFRSPVDVQMYLTPQGRFGFSWHYDAEDVFIVQTSGEKDYFLRKNTVHPWPLKETLPPDMKYERELMPLSRVRLRAGDLLYIPCGYWHRAEATSTGETCISLAIGIMSPAAIDILDVLRPVLIQSIVWRQRLAVGVEANVEERFRTLLGMLAEDAARTLRDPQFLAMVVQRYRIPGL